MNTCSTCRWWTREDLDTYGRVINECGSCGHPNIIKGYGMEVPNDGAVIENDEGWAMFTGPAFGCNLWDLQASSEPTKP